jgi:cytoskeletal protein CcmA (bactofilin family)
MKKKINQGLESPDRLNVLVTGTKVVGDIVADSNIRIDGEVKGNVVSSSKVVLGENGVINGDLNCGDADVEGMITGTIKVEGLLSLRKSAQVSGDISTARLQVEEGAKFSGSCTMGAKAQTSGATEAQEGMVY